MVMTRILFRLLAGSALPLALSAAPLAPVVAADPPAKTAAAPAMATPSTATFLTNTAVANLFEIESSKVALAKSKNDKVKAFANQMVTDHTAAGTKFKQAVADAKLALPAEKLDAKHQALLDDLKKQDGAAFDTAYIKAQNDGHVETVGMFEAYAKSGDNARMKQFASDMLPTLKMHLDHVSKLK
jgi:putative membrane protein